MTKLAAIAALCLSRHMVPTWIVPEQWNALNPPPALITTVRSPENLHAACMAIHVREAKRYAPTATSTFCNIATADICQLLSAPLPHKDPVTGAERPINTVINSLRAGTEPGWYPVLRADVSGRVARGLPTVFTLQEAGHGHVAIGSKVGPDGLVRVTAAGRACMEDCKLEETFGPQNMNAIEVWGHE